MPSVGQQARDRGHRRVHAHQRSCRAIELLVGGLEARAVAASSIAYAFTTAMPEIVSWSWLESSARPSCTARLLRCIARPKPRAISTKSGYGISTSSGERARRGRTSRRRRRRRGSAFWTTESSPGPSSSRTDREIVHAAAHQVAGAPAEEERLGQALEVREQVVAHLVLDLARRVEDRRARQVAAARPRSSVAPASKAQRRPHLAPGRARRSIACIAQPTSDRHRDEGGRVAERRRDAERRRAAGCGGGSRRAGREHRAALASSRAAPRAAARAQRRYQRATRARSTPRRQAASAPALRSQVRASAPPEIAPRRGHDGRPEATKRPVRRRAAHEVEVLEDGDLGHAAGPLRARCAGRRAPGRRRAARRAPRAAPPRASRTRRPRRARRPAPGSRSKRSAKAPPATAGSASAPRTASAHPCGRRCRRAGIASTSPAAACTPAASWRARPGSRGDHAGAGLPGALPRRVAAAAVDDDDHDPRCPGALHGPRDAVGLVERRDHDRDLHRANDSMPPCAD